MNEDKEEALLNKAIKRGDIMTPAHHCDERQCDREADYVTDDGYLLCRKCCIAFLRMNYGEDNG